MLKSFLNNYFGFNRQQRNGLFILVLISCSLLIVRLVYPVFIKPDPIVLLNLPLVEKKLDSTSAASEKFAKKSPDNYRDKKDLSKPLHLFVFDPNSVSVEQLLQLGFREKTAQALVKFRNKGFIFRQKKDLQKVYGVSDNLFAQLEPYILIAEIPTKESKRNFQSTTAERPLIVRSPVNAVKPIQGKIELNSADSASLVSLNGIGAGYAKRILKYRSMLGGYTSVDQLKEVYGFTEDLYEEIKSNFNVDARAIKKINLNKDDFKILNKHPYLTYEITKTIFDWRRKTTINPTNLKDILNDPSLYQKLLPYLAFD